MTRPERRSPVFSGRLLALGLTALLAPLVGCGRPDPPRNAILIVLDTLRADRLSTYGYPVETSPNMDRLAAEGVMFETVVSGASWTLPAMAGMMAGDVPTKNHFDTQLGRSLVEDLRAGGLHTCLLYTSPSPRDS